MNDIYWCLLFPFCFFILFCQIFSCEKTISKRRLDINMILWTFLTCAELEFSLRQTSFMKGNFRGSLWWQFQFWLWKSIPELTHSLSWKWWYFLLLVIHSVSLPVYVWAVFHSLQILITDFFFFLSNACRWEALKAMQSGGWYMAQSIYDLWDLFQVQGIVSILPNGLETDLHCTEPSNLLLVCLFPIEHLHHAALFQNHYLLFPFTFHPDFTISVKSGQMDVFI